MLHRSRWPVHQNRCITKYELLCRYLPHNFSENTDSSSPYQSKVTNQQKTIAFLPLPTSFPSQPCQRSRGIKTHPPEVTISEKSPLTDSHTAKYLSAIPTQCFFHILVPSKAPSQV